MKQISFAKPWITNSDIEAVSNVLMNQDRLTDGEQCKKFEEEFGSYITINEVHCLATSSCMTALHLAYMALEIGPGDEVLCTAMSHVATAHAIELVGATPVFVDCYSDGNLSEGNLERFLTPKTKAIALVHFLGKACNMTRIMNFAESYGLKVIEDCALAVDSYWNGKHVGLYGDVGCFSFYPAKHMTTGEGGMLISKSSEIAGKARLRARFGRSLKDKYDIIWLGSNYRMSEIIAALGRSQLKRMNNILERRNKRLSWYHSKLDYVISTQIFSGEGTYALGLQLPSKARRDALLHVLKEKGIGYSVYYKEPIPRLPYYKKKYGYKKAWFTNAERISDASVCLPLGIHIGESDMEYICNTLNEVRDLWWK